MAGTLSRFTTFVPATPILSAEMNSELNQLVNLLNSTSSNIKLSVKVSDAGDAPIETNQLSTGPILRGLQAGVEKFRFNNSGELLTPGLRDLANGSIATFAGGVATFSSIPVLPGSDPTLANQATRKTYVDTRRVRWSAGFIYPDLSSKAVDANFDEIQGILIPGSNFVCTHIWCKVASGGVTGGTIITLRKQPFGSQAQTDLGSFNINSGGADVTTLGVGVEHSSSPLPHTFTANDMIYPVVTTQSGINAKMVWVGFRGYQTTENP